MRAMRILMSAPHTPRPYTPSHPSTAPVAPEPISQLPEIDQRRALCGRRSRSPPHGGRMKPNHKNAPEMMPFRASPARDGRAPRPALPAMTRLPIGAPRNRQRTSPGLFHSPPCIVRHLARAPPDKSGRGSCTRRSWRARPPRQPRERRHRFIPANDMAFLQPMLWPPRAGAGNEPLREAPLGTDGRGRAIALAKAVASCRSKNMCSGRKAAERHNASGRRYPHRAMRWSSDWADLRRHRRMCTTDKAPASAAVFVISSPPAAKLWAPRRQNAWPRSPCRRLRRCVYAAGPMARIQAIGRDLARAGCRIVISPEWQTRARTRKARRTSRLAEALPTVRRSISQHLAGNEPTRPSLCRRSSSWSPAVPSVPARRAISKATRHAGRGDAVEVQCRGLWRTVTLRFHAKGAERIDGRGRARKNSPRQSTCCGNCRGGGCSNTAPTPATCAPPARTT